MSHEDDPYCDVCLNDTYYCDCEKYESCGYALLSQYHTKWCDVHNKQHATATPAKKLK